MPADVNRDEIGRRRRRRVVIVGGGFGGLTAAKELRRADVEVTLLDRMHHHLFQPLLYQLACGGLSAGECATPIRAVLRHAPNTTVLMAEATDLDAERRQLLLDSGERLDYDSLIVACGAQTSYFGKDEWREVSCGLKTLADALDLRNRIYGAFEEAERSAGGDSHPALTAVPSAAAERSAPSAEPSAAAERSAPSVEPSAAAERSAPSAEPSAAAERSAPSVEPSAAAERSAPTVEPAAAAAEREEWMTFVVIGGGPTGVELAGELAIIAKHGMRRDFARINPLDARVILLDAGERVVSAFSEKLSGKVAQELAALGVTVREGARVTAIDARGVTVQVAGREERIASRTVIWAAGVQAAGFAATLARATGASTDRAGRVQIEPDLSVPGHPEISALGDATLLAPDGGRPLPGLATVAIQQARHVAKAIHRGAPGATTPFRYFDKGALAVVGRGKAVCEIRGHELSGRPAFFTYLTVHMYYLSGGGPGHRLKVLIDWISSRLGDPQNQVIEGELASVERAPPRIESPAAGSRQPSSAGSVAPSAEAPQ
jgi:NADH dehydrogenase FAD-containing subunit